MVRKSVSKSVPQFLSMNKLRRSSRTNQREAIIGLRGRKENENMGVGEEERKDRESDASEDSDVLIKRIVKRPKTPMKRMSQQEHSVSSSDKVERCVTASAYLSPEKGSNGGEGDVEDGLSPITTFADESMSKNKTKKRGRDRKKRSQHAELNEEEMKVLREKRDFFVNIIDKHELIVE